MTNKTNNSDNPSRSTISSPHIQVFALGGFQTNCMILTESAPTVGSRCWIIDCGYEPSELLDAVQEQELIVEKIILTHAHADHIAGLNEARSRLGPIPILMHQSEESWLNDPMLNLSAALGLNVTAPSPDSYLDDGDTVSLGKLRFRVAHTPGHSPGSISLIHEASKTAIVGDTLFNGSIGRTDFPGSSFEVLSESIKSKLYCLDPETVCYPGHGPTTTIGNERSSNPFVHS
jgi:hydroxyacylglutathione hydrolase